MTRQHAGGDPDYCEACRADPPAFPQCPGPDPDLARLQQEAAAVADLTGLHVDVYPQRNRYGVTIGSPTAHTSTGGHTWQQTWTLLYGIRLTTKHLTRTTR